MPDATALDAYYQTLTGEELLKLRADGGFTEESRQALDKELARRNLTSDEAKRRFAPEWLDKAEAGSVGVFLLEGGERVIAEVAGLDEDRLSVNVISLEDLPWANRPNHRTIPLHRIVSFEPQPHLMERWPFSDPCRDKTFSLPRFVLMATIFLFLIVGSLPLFVLLTRRPHGLQEASMIAYTLSVLFFTFAKARGLRPFKFKCPAVRPQTPRLLWRHLGFLVVFFALQTAMFAVRPQLSGWWNMQDRRGMTPFDHALLLLCCGLGGAQVFSNRSLLQRAHREFSG